MPDRTFQRWIKQDVNALDGRTRSLLWRYAVGGYAMGAVGTGDLDGDGLPDVVAPFMDGFVYALHGRNGSLLWRAALEEGGGAAVRRRLRT
ncbi:MAG: hypothetical protein HYZ53_07035 [Planctomycetes bacterium]|nr:hypothetical protein [Planctomycetota bacterium]